MTINEVRDFLKEKLSKDAKDYYGVKDEKYIDEVTDQWFNDQNNYDERWKMIQKRLSTSVKVLDMAAGCGTFILYGLQNGYDVWGIEPEKWKREYYKKKIFASNYPNWFLNRVISGVGERMPFSAGIFDLVTTYQTLEHVQDVNICLQEMLRVIKPGGVLYIKAPDYSSFFEPHYRILFFPKMNKKLAAIYLKLMGRPVEGLKHLQWITERKILLFLKTSQYHVDIQRTGQKYFEIRKNKIKNIVPVGLRYPFFIRFLSFIADMKTKLNSIGMFGRQEKSIDLWVKKLK